MMRQSPGTAAESARCQQHEAEAGRERRRRQRVLFDSVAALYDASRPVYADEAVNHFLRTAGLGSGSAVLEVGCGTGQLTRQLAAAGLTLTAIDIGPSMIAVARRRIGSSSVTFQATSFENLAAQDGSFAAIVFADAFHWIDPELRFSKSARLLGPGGWLTRPGPTTAEMLGESGYFGTAVEASYSTRLSVSASSVVDLENTRATTLSWPDAQRRAFTEELRGHLPSESVGLTQVATVTMAQVATEQ